MADAVKIVGSSSIPQTLQISHMGDIPEGADFKIGRAFLIKATEDTEITIILAGDLDTQITTMLYEGWNPEMCYKIISAPAGLQYGY